MFQLRLCVSSADVCLPAWPQKHRRSPQAPDCFLFLMAKKSMKHRGVKCAWMLDSAGSSSPNTNGCLAFDESFQIRGGGRVLSLQNILFPRRAPLCHLMKHSCKRYKHFAKRYLSNQTLRGAGYCLLTTGTRAGRLERLPCAFQVPGLCLHIQAPSPAALLPPEGSTNWTHLFIFFPCCSRGFFFEKRNNFKVRLNGSWEGATPRTFQNRRVGLVLFHLLLIICTFLLPRHCFCKPGSAGCKAGLAKPNL